MEFKTSISKVTEDDMILRGEKHSNIINAVSFSDAIFFLFKSQKPKKSESRIFSALLTACIDHGIGTTSTLATRTVMSGGNSLNTAVGAGILALGTFHGGAIEGCMRELQKIKETKKTAEEYVSQMLKEKKTILGFGHKVYKKQDPRVMQLISLCKEEEIGTQNESYITLAKSIEEEIEKQKGKKIILNIDGLCAAILLEMNFSAEEGNGIFIIARTPGLTMHAIEERSREKPVRRIEENNIQYDGK
ncbi:MAG: citryl-CoA lyase [Candidatus Woesearchaeota archaeon]